MLLVFTIYNLSRAEHCALKVGTQVVLYLVILSAQVASLSALIKCHRFYLKYMAKHSISQYYMSRGD